MEFKPTFKQNGLSNKDKLKIIKHNKKHDHEKKVKQKLDKKEKKKENEKYMRRDRKYWEYFVCDILPHKYMYKMKDSVLDWLQNNEIFQDMTDSAFWNYMACNSHSIFMMFDKKNNRYFSENLHNHDDIIHNKNADIICELLITNILQNVKEYEDLRFWKYICKYGGPRTICVLEDNIEKYQEAYGEYYPQLYAYLTSNPNAMRIIKKYYDRMFDESCHWYIIENPHPEACDIVEKFYDNLFTFEMVTTADKNIMKHGSARLIKKVVLEMGRPFMISYLMENENAVDIIKEFIESDDYYNYIHWELLNLNSNAFDILLDYPEKINYLYLSSNKNSMSLLEPYITKVMANDETENEINKHGLCSNINAFHLIEKYPKCLSINILENPKIFELNYHYLRRKFDYVTHEEEKIMCQFMEKKIEYIEPRLLNKLNTDYISQSEIEIVVDKYARKNKYLPEHELIFHISYERLIRAVYSPRRVFYYLHNYNYDIHKEVYCDI